MRLIIISFLALTVDSTFISHPNFNTKGKTYFLQINYTVELTAGCCGKSPKYKWVKEHTDLTNLEDICW